MAAVVAGEARRRPLVTAAVAALLVSPALGLAGSAGSGAAATWAGHPTTAVVAFSGTAAVQAAGVRVLDVFRRVGAELVRATPAALARLAADPRVVGISPDRTVHVAGQSYGGDVPGVLAAGTVGEDAGTPGACAGVTVALLDTGVSDTPALDRASGRVVDGVDVSRLAGGGPALTSGQFTDGYGHGTFLASLIAGGRVPGSGERGVGVAPGARIVVVKVADDSGTTSLSEVLAGLDWVAAHAPAINVVNIALAQDRPGPAYGADPLTAGVEHVRDAGVTVVVAAGNTPGQVGDPGMDPRVVTVGAADTTGGAQAAQVASFSGYGVVAGVAKPDLVAPGVHLLGEIPPGSLIAQQHPDAWQPDGLFRGSGTSEATAVTTGAVAMFLARHPGLTPVQVKASLRAAALPLGDARAGTGLLTLPHLVRDGVQASGPAAGTDWTGESGFDASSWSANAWLASSWSSWLASSWSGPAWDASSWSTSSWSASSWSASSWSTSSWSASSWSASSWSASSWSASSWSASSWSASSWSTSSWSSSSWSDASWGA